MTRKLMLLAPAVLAAAALAVGGAFSATGPVTIVAPTDHTKVEAKHDPYLAVAGTATFAATTAGTARFFLRRDGCGTSNDNPHLSVTSGTDAGDGCGLVLDQVGLVGDVDQASFTDYPASNGMPLALDGTKPISGRISLSGAQVGLAEVDVTLEALVGGQAVTIGSATGSAILDPTGASTPVPFTIAANTTLDGSDLQALDLRVRIHGPNVYSGFVALSGASYVDLPDYAASVHKAVQISIDDPSFSSPVTARLNGSDWSVAVPTPAPGRHTVYARATQGYDTSAVASSSFEVKR